MLKSVLIQWNGMLVMQDARNDYKDELNKYEGVAREVKWETNIRAVSSRRFYSNCYEINWGWASKRHQRLL